MSERRVIAPMFVESGGEHPKNVTHSDVESAIIMSRIKSEFEGKIDGVLRVYYNLKAIPVGESRLFLVDPNCGTVSSFVLGMVDLKLPVVEKLASGEVTEPEAVRSLLKNNIEAFLDFEKLRSPQIQRIDRSGFQERDAGLGRPRELRSRNNFSDDSRYHTHGGPAGSFEKHSRG